MKSYILFLVTALLLPFIVECSSKERTKWTDPAMRVMVDPEGLPARDYIRIVSALKRSGKWFVVDRKDGLRAIFKEQKMIHRDRADQFKDEEKYSIWGRLYGIGGVVIGHVDCTRKTGFFSSHTTCKQNLAVVSANSGEVLSTSETDNDDAVLNYSGDIKIGSDWTDAVSELNNNFPKNYEKLKYSDDMELFREEAKQEAIQQKENIGHDKANEKFPSPEGVRVISYGQ